MLDLSLPKEFLKVKKITYGLTNEIIAIIKSCSSNASSHGLTNEIIAIIKSCSSNASSDFDSFPISNTEELH